MKLTHLTYCNVDMLKRILMIFGRNVTQKV